MRVGGVGGLYMEDIKRFLAERGVVVEGLDLWRLSAAAGTAGFMANEALLRVAPHPEVARFPDWSHVAPTLDIPRRTLVVEEHWDEYAAEPRAGRFHGQVVEADAQEADRLP